VSDTHARGLWLAIALLAAALTGAVAGVLSLDNGSSTPSAVLTGGSAFAATTLLILAAIRFVRGSDA
jgi:hypothetical protein